MTYPFVHPLCSVCKKSVEGNVYFVRGDTVLCYRCEGRRRKDKRKKKVKGETHG